MRAAVEGPTFGQPAPSAPPSRPLVFAVRPLRTHSLRIRLDAAKRSRVVALALRPELRLTARRPPTRSQDARGDEPRQTAFDSRGQHLVEAAGRPKSGPPSYRGALGNQEHRRMRPGASPSPTARRASRSGFLASYFLNRRLRDSKRSRGRRVPRRARSAGFAVGLAHGTLGTRESRGHNEAPLPVHRVLNASSRG